jgi:hypothetical protein
MSKTSMLGLVAVGAVLAAGAVQAQPQLVSLKHGLQTQASLFKYLGVHPNLLKVPVSDSVTVPGNVTTVIDAWTFADFSSCQELGMPGLFGKGEKDDKIVYTFEIVTVDVGCGPWTFSQISADWMGKGHSGSVHYNHFTETQKGIPHNVFGLPHKADIFDSVTLTHQ